MLSRSCNCTKQLQSSFDPYAGKKIEPARDTYILATSRFYGALSKVSRIRAPGRRHFDMGSSCMALVPFLWVSVPRLRSFRPGSPLEFHFSPHCTDRQIAGLPFRNDSVGFSWPPATKTFVLSKKDHKVHEPRHHRWRNEKFLYRKFSTKISLKYIWCIRLSSW